MKKTIIILFLGLIIYGVYEHFKVFTPKVLSDEIVTTPTPADMKTLMFKEVTRGYAVINNIPPQKLTLIPNYSEKISTENLMAANACQSGINGGFYSESDKPIGLLTVNGITINTEKNTQTFNGFIKVDGEKFSISENSSTSAKTVLQTGPLLIEDQKTISFNINNDKLARRMVMAKNIFNKAVIVAVFDPETKQSGPLLSELPEIISQISTKENLGITEAINLDGGRASAFYSPMLTLKETDPVGSWWCIK
jgi:exopolysaccharide biosynthesis protein